MLWSLSMNRPVSPGPGDFAPGLPARPATAWQSDPATALVALMALAVFFGAGGVGAAFGNLAVQLAALAVLAVHGSAVRHFIANGPRALAALAAASCLLPLIQLVPLPPTVWQALPGRDLVAQSLDLAGGRGWFPLSVDRGRTLVAFLGTIAPLTVIAVGYALSPAGLVRVQQAAVAIGLLAALFGATHLLDPAWGDFYADQLELPGVLVATFADRNAAALFLDCCLLLLVSLPALPRRPLGLMVAATAGAFMAICVVLTRSRSGMALMAIPVALLGWRIVSAKLAQERAGRAAWLGGLALAFGAAIAVVSSGQVQASLARFAEGDEMRAEMREDAGFVVARYWPVGAGMGTFDEVFQIDESLEYVSPRRAGRAHMDYLELAIEAGAAGLVLAALWLGWVLWAGWRALRRPGAWPARAGALIIACIAAQSLLSFPLRNQAMLCVAALAILLLARSPTAGSGERR